MHDVEIPQEHLDRVIRRRGTLHIFENFNPDSTALFVVDMQNAFIAPGALAEVPKAREISPNINRMANALRDAGGCIVWIHGHVESNRGPWAHYLANLERHPDAWTAALEPGSEGWQFWSELDVHDDDLIVGKDRYSAFWGHGNLAEKLRDRNINTVIVVGTLTNSCCESTARDAMQNNFATIMVMDANACRSDEDHLATMCTFINSFGDVLTTEQIVNHITNTQADATRAVASSAAE